MAKSFCMEPYELENLKLKINLLNISNYSKILLLEVIKKAERHQVKVKNTLEIKHSFMMTLWQAFKSIQDSGLATSTKEDKAAIGNLVYEFAGRTLLIQYEAGWLDKTKLSPKNTKNFMKIDC